MPQIDLISMREGYASDWTASNPILMRGEPGWEYDTGRMKVGNGTTPWNSLPYTAVEGPAGPTGATGPTGPASTVPGPAGPAGAGASDGDKGDIVVSGTGTVWTLDPTVVTAAARTVLDDATTTAMRTTLGLGNVDNTTDASKPVSTAQAAADALKADKTTQIATTAPLTGGGDLSATRTLGINTFTQTVKGAVPPPVSLTGAFLKDDGTWAAPAGGGGGITTEDAVDATAAAFAAGTHTNITVTYNDAANSISLAGSAGGGGVTDGDKGDIVVSGSGATWMFDTAVVTATAKTILDDTSMGAVRTTLGLGNVNNTADVDKPVSTATQAALDTKVDKPAIVTHSGTAITGALTDAGDYLRFTGTNPTYTVPPNSTVAFPVGTQIDGMSSATAMTLVQGSGVTINRARTLVTLGAKSGWTLVKVATDEWDTHGDYV